MLYDLGWGWPWMRAIQRARNPTSRDQSFVDEAGPAGDISDCDPLPDYPRVKRVGRRRRGPGHVFKEGGGRPTR